MNIIRSTSQSYFHLSLIFIEMKFYSLTFCVISTMKSMNVCNDKVNYDEIII